MAVAVTSRTPIEPIFENVEVLFMLSTWGQSPAWLDKNQKPCHSIVLADVAPVAGPKRIVVALISPSSAPLISPSGITPEDLDRSTGPFARQLRRHPQWNWGTGQLEDL